MPAHSVGMFVSFSNGIHPLVQARPPKGAAAKFMNHFGNSGEESPEKEAPR